MNHLKHLLFEITEYFERSILCRSIRKGIILMIPFIIINCFITMLINLPIPVYQELLHTPHVTPIRQGLETLSAVIGGYFSILMTISLSWSFAREKHFHIYQTILFPLLTTICFLILIGFHTSSFYSVYMTSAGILSCLIAVIITGQLYSFLLSRLHNIHYKIDTQMHTMIYSILPLTIVILVFAIAQTVFLTFSDGDCLQTLLVKLMDDIFHLFTYFPLFSTAVFLIMVQLLWFLGINGNNILFNINDNYFHELFQENVMATAMGTPPPNIIHSAFNSSYLMLGGSGDILGLLIAVFLLSHNRSARSIAKLSLFPSIFNISEIASFGIPLVWNPIFFLPFVITPVVNLLIAYTATSLGLVPILQTEINWTTPIFLSGYISSGSISVIVLQLLLLCTDFLLYAPFIRLSNEQKNHHFTKCVRDLEARYKHLEITHEQLRISELPDYQQNIATLLINDLSEAIQQKELFMLYQPQINAQAQFLGAEALLRWQHPMAGFIYPPLIIALAKSGNLLPALEQFIFQETCHTIADLRQHLKIPFKVSVNITGESLKYAELEQSIEYAVQKASIDPSALWIEITEQDAIDTTTEAIAKLTRLKEKGHRLLIDDFCMGHTSVAYLKTNLFDVIKLDGSITRNVLSNPNNQKIISSLISLSHTMDLEVIAEYVDNVPQRDKLQELGCNKFQGYLYSKPVSMSELLTFISRNKYSGTSSITNEPE